MRAQMNRQTGLTLLELVVSLLVMTILTSVAITSVSGIQEQARYEKTVQLMEDFRNAILGPNQTMLGEPVFSGFVVHNGRLPGRLKDLISKPTGFSPLGIVNPIYDPTPDTNGLNNNSGDEIPLTHARYTLLKGYPISSYLYSQDGIIQDGFGNGSNGSGGNGKDCPITTLPTPPVPPNSNQGSDLFSDNFGWCVTALTREFYIDSYGSDGQAGGSSPFEKDIISKGIHQDEAFVDINTLTIRVNAINPAMTAKNLRATLLAFVNDSSGGKWKRFTSKLACVEGASSGTKRDYDGSGTQGDQPEEVCGPSQDLIFTDKLYPGGGSDSLVPIGEHIILIVEDPDVLHTQAHNGNETLYPNNNTPLSAKTRFISKSLLPNIKIDIQ